MPEHIFCEACGEAISTKKVWEKVSAALNEKRISKNRESLRLCPKCRKKHFVTNLVGNSIQRVSGPKYIPKRRTESIMSERYDSRTGCMIYKSQCWSCNDGCDVWVYVKDGRVMKVEGDPSSVNTRGILCPKGLSARYLLYHPDRLRHPLKRAGQRGEGKWKRISWEEALDTIATKFREIERKYNDKDAILFATGTSRGWYISFIRLINALRRQFVSPGHAQCFWPRYTSQILQGIYPALECPDVNLHPDKTKCILVWGTNPPNTTPIRAAWMMDAKGLGAKLIVVDPLLSETAAKADIWLQLRPGTDPALALGMLHVIINEDLYDCEFVETWCNGFDALRERVQDYPPNTVEEITWVPKDKIIEAARVFAKTKPACIMEWLAIEQVPDTLSACLSLGMLSIITGNLDVPGGNIFPMPRDVINWLSEEVNLKYLLTAEDHEKRCGSKEFPLLAGEDAWLPTAHGPTVWRTILTGKPYPIRGMYCQGSNPVLSFANSKLVEKALKSLEFIAVADLFMTPTSELADIVLPVGTWLERTDTAQNFQVSYNAVHLTQKVVEIDECWSDYKIITELGRKLGVGHLLFDSEEDYCDYLLKPSGITFQEFKKMGTYSVPYTYKKYEKRGFATPAFKNLHPTNKVELSIQKLKDLGFDPLPRYKEPSESPYNSPDLAKEYPLIITTGRKEAVFRHTESRNIPVLREIVPDCEIHIHPETADDLGIKQGENVIVESPRGSMEAKAYLTEGIHPKVIFVPGQWPGKNNANILIHDEDTAPAIGGTQLRSQLCRVRRAH